MEFVHIPKELNDLSDRVLSHRFLGRRGSTQVWAGKLDNEEGVGGAGPTEHTCDLAQGHKWYKKNR